MKEAFLAICFLCLTSLAPSAQTQSTGPIVGWGTQIIIEKAALEDLVALAGGENHSMGLKSDGTIVAWGSNANGQSDVPAPNTNFVAIACGLYHSLGVRSNGEIAAWGSNIYGQCDVSVLNEDFVTAAGGQSYSLGLKSDGTIAAWGATTTASVTSPRPTRASL